MKIIECSLALAIDRWDDPGDYPSGAGSGALPSYDYVAGIDGSVTVELEPSDLEALEGSEGDMDAIKDYIIESLGPSALSELGGIHPTKWNMTAVAERRFSLEVEDFDPSSWEPHCEADHEVEWEPDFGDYDD